MSRQTVVEKYEDVMKLLSDSVPHPTGYRVLVKPLKVEEKTAGGIYMPDKEVDRESVANVIGLVLELGDDAYCDATRFPSGAWCKPGDYVLYKPYSGTRIVVKGEEVRLINDDTILSVISDPGCIERAW